MHASDFELSADKVIYREFGSIYRIILHELHLFWYTFDFLVSCSAVQKITEAEASQP